MKNVYWEETLVKGKQWKHPGWEESLDSNEELTNFLMQPGAPEQRLSTRRGQDITGQNS